MTLYPLLQNHSVASTLLTIMYTPFFLTIVLLFLWAMYTFENSRTVVFFKPAFCATSEYNIPVSVSNGRNFLILSFADSFKGRFSSSTPFNTSWYARRRLLILKFPIL